MIHKPKGVCEQDCPDRELGCHGKCEKYLDYRKQSEEQYKQNERELRLGSYSIDAILACKHNPPLICKKKSKGGKP